jgi:hypothetical protein
MVAEREAPEARMAAERVALEVRMAAEWEAEQRRLAEILRYMQSLDAAQGMPPPPGLFAPPPPPDAATSVSMNVLVCMFMFRVKSQQYLEPSGV